MIIPPLFLGLDSYVLAYRYHEYMKRRPLSKDDGEKSNPYYENLLANQPMPDPSADDPRSCATRYAKEHHESFYEMKDINMVVQMLDRRAAG